MNPEYKGDPFLQACRQIPLFPIYGYDNSEEAQKDFDYMKQLYPRSSRKIQELIEDTCDQLEYEGSPMFDEYPDRLRVAMITNRIYSQVAPSARPETAQTFSADADTDPLSAQQQGKPNHPGGSNRPVPPPWRPTPPGSEDPDWLRNLIEIMLCNEMCQRRRRYRSRKRWM